MNKRHVTMNNQSNVFANVREWICTATLALAAFVLPAQQSQPTASAETHITPEQAKQLFSLVDELIAFSSNETGLPINSTVKRKMTMRSEVESYLKAKFEEDESAKRMQRGEIVLKKFGLLERDFALKPFLQALLKEQLEAYYDPKTKTVYMLDWVGIDEQKAVLAHELTHALQDQHSDLDKWNNQTPDAVSQNAVEDVEHVAKDELDSAREAVVEGQATVVMMDYLLKPLGKSLIKDPEILDMVKQHLTGADNSPVLSKAPLLLSESLLFPYREGLSFEQDVWMDKGQAAAFTGTLDHPPTSTWEILNPREYEKHHTPAVPLMPDIHPLVDAHYKPYDIGQMGQLDLQILTQTYGGEMASRDLTPAWDGGIYWAGQRLNAKVPSEQPSTNSIALFYLSAWKNEASAQAFARLYAGNLGHQFQGAKSKPKSGFAVYPPPPTPPEDSIAPTSTNPAIGEQVYSTSEGPVVITTRGKYVFVAESFDLDVARKLAELVLDAQGSGEIKTAQAAQRDSSRYTAEINAPLTSNLIRFLSDCGVMKAAVRAGNSVTHAASPTY